MKRYILINLVVLFVTLPLFAVDKLVKKETFVYATKDAVDLKLDKYNVADGVENKTCVIFMFGGGFVSGERDSDRYMKYFDTLAENGMVVLSIDYRRGLADIKSSSIARAEESDFVKMFDKTLDLATEDLIDATAYALENAKQWDIDAEKIMISGSSAGAISVLHGEYAVANSDVIAKPLPEDFRYAGVISMAGAIFSMHGELEWKTAPCPMLFFHGNADRNVPYGAIELGYLGFYGSKAIAGQLEKMKIPYYFYDEEYAGHELADSPMQVHLGLILNFIDNEIVRKKGLRVHSIVKVNGREAMNTNFTIRDYILSNFSSGD